jgi:putative DNA primase/helicase
LAGPCRCGETHSEGSFQSPPIEREVPERTDNVKGRLEKIFAGTQPVASGDPVDLYLLSRKIRLNPYPRDLRTHMALGYWEDGQRIGTYPAMVAVVRDAMGRPVGLSRIWFTTEGQKAPVSSPKKLTPLVGRSNAIQLFPFDTRLAIAEGIETALSFQTLSGIPTWSCISSGGIERFTPPPGIREIIIAGDHDKAGIMATEKLVNRIGTHGTFVKTVFPDTPGEDWNDVLMGVSHG